MATNRKCAGCGCSMNLYRADAKTCSVKCRVRVSRSAKMPAFPAELLTLPNWVRRDSLKRPLQVGGSAARTNDAATWSTYAEAFASTAGVGLGFVLDGDGIGVIDLDHAIVDGVVAGWAQVFLDANPVTFVEVSQSGNGLHIWGLLEARPGSVVRDGRNVEVYSTGRYIAIGTRRAGAPLRLSPLLVP